MRRIVRVTAVCAVLSAAVALNSTTLTAVRGIERLGPLASVRAVTSEMVSGVTQWLRGATRADVVSFSDGAAQQAAASVQTDKLDYAPGETALISGSGFGAGEEVTFQVTHVDGAIDDGAGHASWTVTADEAGAIAASWYVDPDDSLGSTFLLTATGASGTIASWTFTDGPNDPTLGDQNLAGAPSGDGITPVVWNGNPTCSFFSPSFFEYKKDMAGSGYHGTYTQTLGGVTVSFTVTSSPGGDLISWTSTLGVTSVFVKGSNQGNLYTYPAEDYGDTLLHAPINSSGGYAGLSHISFCFDKDLSIKKDVLTSLTRTYTWSIAKSGDNTYSKFIGDPVSPNAYSVTVDQTVIDSDWAAAGDITIYNDTPDAATISTVTDVVTGPFSGTVTCPGGLPQTLASGATLVCDYTASLPDAASRENKATVTTSGGDVQGGEGTAPVSFASAVVTQIGDSTVNVTDSNGGLGSASGDANWNYSKDFACSTNAGAYGEDGSYSFVNVNTATITETGQSDTATVTVNCYAPVVSKTASTAYTRNHEWTIDKSVTPDALSGFIGGGAGTSTYTVAVDETETESGFKVSGSIVVVNPNPASAMTVNVADSLSGAIVNCGEGPGDVSLTVAPGGSGTCGYGAGVPTKDPGTNTATATLNNIGFSGSAAYSFANAEVEHTGYQEVNVSDTNGEEGGPFSDDGSFTYNRSFSCSADPGGYANGVDTDVYGNTAQIDETYESDDADVTVSCYAPSVSKTAATSYTRTHAWTIAKSVNQSSATLFLGQSTPFNYTVSVDETETEDGFKVSGTITVNNPHPSNAMTVTVADLLPAATVTCGAGGSSLTVPAAGSASCSYEADTTKTDGTNSATASINGVVFSASASYAFGDPTTVVGPPTIGITDTNPGTGPWSGVTDDKSFTYTVNRSCSTDTADYTNGVDTDVYPNTATITETGAADSESVSVTCYIPAKANVLKTTTEGDEPFGDAGFTFSLELGGSSLETASTAGAGSVAFAADLTVTGAYSVIELLPAGWLNENLVCDFNVAYPGSAGVVYECSFHNREVGRVTVLKHTEGQIDSTQTWTFKLLEGPNAACGVAGPACTMGAELASSGTSGDLDGLLEFANTNLDPNKTYTVCEIGAPAGWSSVWILDANGDGVYDLSGEIVTPYNPNASGAVPQDLGNRCMDFTPGAGQITAFNVNNTFPGGEPRTIGYWKNWNACSASGGNQVAVAAKNGGPAEGWFLLEDLLPQTLGALVVDTCAEGVSILSKSSLDGKNRANDGAYELAAQLLAALLNEAAGAENCSAAQQARLDGQALLASIGFNGMDAELPSRSNKALATLRAQALALAKTLDQYNNGNLCQ